jgi:nitrite reductase (NO-forming)
MEGQPVWIKTWVHFWCFVVGVDPRIFAYLTALGETLVAIGLILGIFSTLTDLFGAGLMLLIWSAAEGFGGPYSLNSLDVGSAIIYALFMLALWFSNAGRYLGLDAYLGGRLGRWRWLALPAPSTPFS